MDMNTGLSVESRKAVVLGLNKVLADSYTLYLKTHHYHWNVTGPLFSTLHLLFEQQYAELALAVDELAERIRALGHFAPGSYKEFEALTIIKTLDHVPNAHDMIKDLLVGNESVIRTCREAFPAAEKASDQATMDLLTRRIETHEKAAWMLRSLVAND